MVQMEYHWFTHINQPTIYYNFLPRRSILQKKRFAIAVGNQSRTIKISHVFQFTFRDYQLLSHCKSKIVIFKGHRCLNKNKFPISEILGSGCKSWNFKFNLKVYSGEKNTVCFSRFLTVSLVSKIPKKWKWFPIWD
jgi:hypothetical protein